MNRQDAHIELFPVSIPIHSDCKIEKISFDSTKDERFSDAEKTMLYAVGGNGFGRSTALKVR